MLARSDFENAVKEALRHYTQADLLAENALLRTGLLTSSKPGAATPQGLRILLADTAKALFAGERDQRLYHVLDLTYLNPAPKQETAANRLGLSYSTYRRHLTAGVDRLTEWLWKQELEALQVETVAEQTTGSGTAGEELSVQSRRPRLSIVILPFLNLSQDPSVDYLVDGIGDGLMTDLSRAMPGGFVISRSTAFTYKGRQVPVPQIGQELGVRYVLEGSVLVDPRRIRVNVQLIDALTDEHVWAERFDNDRKDALESQDEIVGRLSRSVGIEMVCSEAARGSAGNSEDVIDLVMRARALANDIRQRENVASPIELLRQALELDPDRRKLLAAMAALCEKPALASEKTASITPTTPKEVIAGSTSSSAERRQLTVMFCDLVGSTALSARLDPEDLREVIGAYHRCCAAVIERGCGFVAKYMGDRMLAYFGYPRADEHDAERAVRAGLQLVEAVAGLDTAAGVPLQTRVGIATGLVVVGDLIGEGSAQEQSVVGETPDLAARLHALAEPGTVVIGPSTRRLTAGLFDYEDLGSVEIKGSAAPVMTARVLRESAVEGRFAALRTAGTPLVGRDEELALLQRRWQQAKGGEGSIVLVSGEPGIGKSRLAQALLERLSGEPYTRLRLFCSPHHQDHALYPTITQLERAAGFRREDTAAQRLDKLEAVLAQGTNDLGAAAPLLAALLSLPTGERYAALDLTPQKQKEKTLRTLLAQVEGLALQQPALLLFEDAQWSDPTSLELLDLVIDRVSTLSLLLIITFRPEFIPPWTGRPHVTWLSLNRLVPRQRAEMISGVTGGKALPQEIADQIIDRTDGVPLFVEELTKAVVESDLLTDAGDRYTAAGPVAPLTIPATLQASLLARLDRLAPVREVAQIGAALGRHFSHELIGALVAMPQAQLNDALAQLVNAELIYRRGTPPDAEYTFKHALVQDAAYSTLLRSRRQQLHARIAAILEGRFSEIVASQPALLAHHCTEAGLTEKAIAYWLAAGRQAWGRSAAAEAVALLHRGLALVPALPDGDRRRETELDLRIALGQALIMNRSWGVPELGEVHSRARELASALNRPRALLFALWGQFTDHWARADLKRARQLAAELRELGDTTGDVPMQVIGCDAGGMTCFHLGEFTTGRAYLEKALALYDPAHRPSYSELLSYDLLVVLRMHSSWVLACLGHLDQALFQRNAALDEARGLSHPPTLAVALGTAPRVAGWCVRLEPGSLLQHANELLALATEHGLGLYRMVALLYRGWCLAALGRADEGIPLITAGSAGLDELGYRAFRPWRLALLGDACRMAGQSQLALGHVAAARRLAEETEDRWFQAETVRLGGDVLVAMGDRTGAEASYHEALALAQQQSAKLWELRAAASLARLWRDEGKRTQAHALLAPVYNWFTEDFDTPDLKEAKALVEDLAQVPVRSGRA